MRNNVIPFSPQKTTSPGLVKSKSQVTIRLGAQRYAIEITCQARVLSSEPALPPIRDRVTQQQVQTMFMRLRQPAVLGEEIDGWQVCWLGGWDPGKVFFLVMGKRLVGRPPNKT
jgi:hypothetical protein